MVALTLGKEAQAEHGGVRVAVAGITFSTHHPLLYCHVKPLHRHCRRHRAVRENTVQATPTDDNIASPEALDLNPGRAPAH